MFHYLFCQLKIQIVSTSHISNRQLKIQTIAKHTQSQCVCTAAIIKYCVTTITNISSTALRQNKHRCSKKSSGAKSQQVTL